MNKKYLLDTSIVAELVKKTPSPSLIKKYSENKKDCAISVITWQQLVESIMMESSSSKKDYLTECMEVFARNFEIISFERDAASMAAEINARFSDFKSVFTPEASQIFATALQNKMIFVTHNSIYLEIFGKQDFIQMEDWID